MNLVKLDCCLCLNIKSKSEIELFSESLNICLECRNIIKKNDGIFRGCQNSNESFDKFNSFYESMYEHSDMNLDILYEIKKKPILLTYAIRKLLIIFCSKINPKLIMDIGSGRSENIVSISSHNPNAFIIANDISKNALLISRKFLEKSNQLDKSILIQCPLEELRFKEESADLIICTEVLEHLLDDDIAIKKMNDFLKVGGYAFMSTPCEKGIERTVSFDYGEVLKEGAHGSAAGGDIRRYSYNILIEKFKSNNFEIISERWCGSIFGNLAYKLNNILITIGKKLSGTSTNKKDKYNVRSLVSKNKVRLDASSKFYIFYISKIINFIYWLDVLFKIEGDGHLICVMRKVDKDNSN